MLGLQRLRQAGMDFGGRAENSRRDGENTSLTNSVYESIQNERILYHKVKRGGTAEHDTVLLSQHFAETEAFFEPSGSCGCVRYALAYLVSQEKERKDE